MFPTSADRKALALDARSRFAISEQVIGWLRQAEATSLERETTGWDDAHWAAARMAVQVQGIGPWLCVQLRHALHSTTALEAFGAYLLHCHSMNARRYRLWREQLDAIASEAERSGIALVALKGAAVLPWIWNDPVLRPASDIDVLARAADRSALHDICTRLHWRFQGSVHRHRVYYCAAAGEAPIDDVGEHPMQPLRLEIHEHAVQMQFGFKHDATDLLWRTATRAGTAGLRRPSELATFVHTLAHVGLDLLARGSRFIRLRDLELLARRLPDEAWDQVIANAAASDFDRMFLAPLLLTERHLGPVVPDRVIERLSARTPVRVAVFFARLTFSETSVSGASPPANLWWRRQWFRPGRERLQYARRALLPLRAERLQECVALGEAPTLWNYHAGRQRRWWRRWRHAAVERRRVRGAPAPSPADR